MWAPWEDPGIEHLHLVVRGEDIVADGIIIRVKDGTPFRTHYRIRCDGRWAVREVDVRLLDAPDRRLTLLTDGRGRWTTSSGTPVPALEGCRDVDISATPFTNTLPIRRLGLATGDSAEITVAYVPVPELEHRVAHQRYTCLERSAQGGVYRYEGLFRNFRADLSVDQDGLVIDYPQLCKRAWPR